MAEHTEHAPAKLNLYLHVLGKRADGYHALESLVAFADLADVLRVEEASDITLQVEGPFAAASGAVSDNLVIRAAQLLQRHAGVTKGAAIRLTKHIPVGAGLGGGSADAAATLRALNHLWQLGVDQKELCRLGAALGADVAMCVASSPAIARGVGEELKPIALPPLQAVLVYPQQPLATVDVFRALRMEERRQEVALPACHDARDTYAALATTRNDLQRPAIACCAAVAEVLLALETVLPSPALVRMTGSGSCCFALYENAADAQQAAKKLHAQHPHWWVMHSRIAGSV